MRKSNNLTMRIFSIFVVFILFSGGGIFAQGTIVDHNCTDITLIPENAIVQAKSVLHIGYGHTSHGSQITTGMNGLVNFANNGGLGLSLPEDIFEWNNGGTNGALDLEEGDGYGTGWLDHDCGYYPDWVNETREYLDDASHVDVNVIIWSWCGQASGYSEQNMIDYYLAPMTQLELEYPDVTFVYMTGHADGSGLEGNLHIRNQQIRNYCITNDKVLYDFYDIECYDPDNSYFGDKYVNDDCSYTGGNWALEWQATHTEGIDWFNCSPAHTQALNGNQKAYTAWWLWARLGGWDPNSIPVELTSFSAKIKGNAVELIWSTATETNNYGFSVERKNGAARFNPLAFVNGSGTTTDVSDYSYTDIYPPAGIIEYRLKQIDFNGAFQYSEILQVNYATPEEFVLSQNYPNPFNPSTVICMRIAADCRVKLNIYDIQGRLVSELIDENLPAGVHEAEFDGTGLASGVYYFCLQAGEFHKVRKMILLK